MYEVHTIHNGVPAVSEHYEVSTQWRSHTHTHAKSCKPISGALGNQVADNVHIAYMVYRAYTAYIAYIVNNVHDVCLVYIVHTL